MRKQFKERCVWALIFWSIAGYMLYIIDNAMNLFSIILQVFCIFIFYWMMYAYNE